MLYYVVLWFVRRFASDKPFWPFLFCGLAVIIWYCFEDSNVLFLFGDNYLKWLFFFLYMLMGAYIGNGIITFKSRPWFDFGMLALALVLFYGTQYAAEQFKSIAHLQILTLIPLVGIVLYSYKLCCAKGVDSFMRTKTGLCLRFVAGLCLEAYIVQITIIPFMASIDILFPVNLIITSIFIIIAAYLTRCLARVVSQIFEKEDLDWGKIFEPVN